MYFNRFQYSLFSCVKQSQPVWPKCLVYELWYNVILVILHSLKPVFASTRPAEWQKYSSIGKDFYDRHIFTPAIWKGKIVKTSFNVLSFKVNKTGLICFPIVPGTFMNQLMTGNGITFAWRGKTVMVCGNSTKMENCTLTPGACAQDTQLKKEVPWYWVKNKIQLEEALIPTSPSRGPWPMSTCGPGSFGQVQ